MNNMSEKLQSVQVIWSKSKGVFCIVSNGMSGFQAQLGRKFNFLMQRNEDNLGQSAYK